jgi:hypothetical protein
MKMRKWVAMLAVASLVILVLVIGLRSMSSNPVSSSKATSTSVALPGQPGNPPALPDNSALAPQVSSAGVNLASPPVPPENLAANAGRVEPAVVAAPPAISPEIAVQNVRHAITQFGAMFGGNPVGTNPEITSQLSGNNPKRINFIQPEAGMRINEQGELVDAWGTPLFFHQLSGTDMEVRSAGPDRKLWTPDDRVAK